MYKRELENLLNSNKEIKNILLFGECRYFIENYSKLITKKIDEQSEKMVFYFDEYDFSSAKNYLSQTSLFGDKNILVIKTESKINANELKSLIKISEKVDDSYLIVEYYGNDFRTFQKPFGSNFVRFFDPNIHESVGILSQKAISIDLDIDRYALEHLLATQGFNISFALNELDKLSILDLKITTKDIDRLSYGLGELNLDELIFKILNKDNFFKDLKTLLQKEDEIRVIIAIASFITQLSLFNLFFEINGFVDSKEILGYKLPKQIEEARFRLSKKLNRDSISKMLEHLQKSELILKTEPKIDKEAILYSSLIKLQTLF